MGSITRTSVPDNSFAAPANRPPGMSFDVPYEPMVGRAPGLKEKVTNFGLKLFYDTSLSTVPAKFLDWWRRGELAPLQGTPGTPLADPAGSYRVAMLGDIGEGTPAVERNAAQITKFAPSHVGTLGDNVYPMGREIDWAKRFDKQFESLRMATTWMPALGNHDYYNGNLVPYFSRFPQLQGHAYYQWKVGPADFFVLDTEQRLDLGSKQRAWLETALSQSTAGYKVLQMHRPLVSSHGGASADRVRESLAPLLAKYGVQLVLAGHEHGYERSKPQDGTVHVVSGGGGAATYTYPLGMPDHTQIRTRRNHHLQLAFTAGEMVVRAVDDRGAVFDTFRVLPAGAAARDTAAHGAAFTFTPA